MIRKILVPTDGSALSDHAVNEALSLAKALSASVVTYYAMPAYVHLYMADYGVPSVYSEREHKKANKEYAEKILGKIQAKAQRAGIECSTTSSEAIYAHEGILKAAKRIKADLIVMGSHGRSSIGQLFLGSVATRVINQSQIPVMIVRAPKGANDYDSVPAAIPREKKGSK